ncbi:MAG: filamentous hemagglutinin N-terminal domain-containing protein [Stenomitos rutilans HA7619-LM2]|jgi:filamentous hemagglutinin family protein|nr:filamentous hemagglutinin N-terminal domain-containing protein [Stenomitos rutilans HA7619-LM2]
MAERSWWLHLLCHGLCYQLVLLCFVGLNDRALAQVVPDTTLPPGERSQISPGPLFQINGGAVRDRNLFHSFEQFSLTQGQAALFNNAANITNIISRVTGGQRSSINGLIRANGTANLFLINPSGILFGPNAALNLGGTFLATTASAMQFGSQGVYSATNPEAPPLLTVNPSALLFNQLANQSIISQARLQVPPGQSLALVGGNVLLNQGALLASNGRIELGGLVGKGVVELDGSGDKLHLSFGATDRSLADVTLINQSEANVRSGGSIGIHAQNFSMANRSILRGGIALGEGSPGSKAGDIDLDVPGAVTLTEGSFIANSTLGEGDSGNVNIVAGSVLIKEGSQVNASTFGKGNGGTVTIRSQGAVTFDGEAPNRQYSGTFSRVNEGATGNSGGIYIFADSLAVTNGALLTANTLGKGNAGSVTINVNRDVRFVGVSAIDQFPSGAYSGVQGKAIGSSGGINITAQNLLLAGGAALDASTYGRGDAGKIAIQVSNAVQLKGTPPGQLADPGGIYSFIGEKAIGNSSGISLSARSLSLDNGAALVASTFGQGNAGDINLQIVGPVTIDGGTVFLRNDGTTGVFSSGIFSSVSTIGKGNSGQINFTADSLAVTNGAVIASSTLGRGKTATVNINITGAALFDGAGSDGFPSGIFSRISFNAIGTSDITFTARSLTLTNGAQFVVGRRFPTDKPDQSFSAGTLNVNILDDVRITGKSAVTNLLSGLFSATDSLSNGGDINLAARSLYLQDGATISAESMGKGTAGNIAIRLRNLLLVQDGQILTSATQSAGGNIAIAARFIGLQGDSDLTTSVLSGAGGGGNITLSARAIVALDDSDILAFSRDGSGGTITLRTPAFFGFRYQPNATSNTETLDGNNQVDVNASGRLRAGTVTLPEVTLQPSVTPLPTEVIDTSRLIAHSCIARSARQGSFIVTGAGGLPNQPDDLATAPFPTYTTTPGGTTTPGEAINPSAEAPQTTPEAHLDKALPSSEEVMAEVDGIYQLASGALVLGRSCNGR